MNLDSLKTSPLTTLTSFEGSAATLERLCTLTGDGRIDMADLQLTTQQDAPIGQWRAANGYDPLALENLMKVRSRLVLHPQRWGATYPVEQPDSPALDWPSVRLLVSRKPIETTRFRFAAEMPGRFLYVNPNALARYRAEGCTISRLHERRNHIEVSVSCDRDSVLETSEADYSEWQATLDGNPAPKLSIHEAFRGIRVPAGKHNVAFEYSTNSLVKWAALSAAAWLCWAVLCLWPRLAKPAVLTRRTDGLLPGGEPRS